MNLVKLKAASNYLCSTIKTHNEVEKDTKRIIIKDKDIKERKAIIRRYRGRDRETIQGQRKKGKKKETRKWRHRERELQ